MIKNILVIDETGVPLGRTYPKRARGLLKHGRAVQTDDADTIRMITPVQPKGAATMNAKQSLITAINEMSEAQTHSLLLFLNTFRTDAPEITLPEMPAKEQPSVREKMLATLQEQIAVLAKDDYANPNAVDILKELKDMLNMVLRAED